MANERASEGQPLRISARRWNDAADAGQWFAQSQALGSSNGRAIGPVNPCLVQVKNDTGGNLASGAVVELSSSLLTTLDRKHVWLSGIIRAGADPVCGVAIEPIYDDAIGTVQVSGVCLASVDIIDADNTHARVVPSSTQLTGDFGGYARILHKPSGTGVKLCVVLLGGFEQTIRKAVATSTITASGSGTANVEIAGSVVGSVTVYYDHMTGGGNIASSSDLYIQYFHDQDKWIVIGAECGA